MNWKDFLDKNFNVEFDYPLSRLTTFKIGGEAEALIHLKTEKELKEIIKLKNDFGIPLWVLGGGSNILISDKGINGLVIRLEGEFKTCSINENKIIVGAGKLLSHLVKLTADTSLQGIEMLYGIPGTVGGAIICNAGAWGNAIGESVVLVYGLRKSGENFSLSQKMVGFGYRWCGLKPESIITAVELSLSRGDKEQLHKKMADYQMKKRNSQPLNFKSAGCIFKNPPNNSAGKLIDLAGCKGWREDDAEISTLHANFIINRGKAKAIDVFKLMQRIIKAVKMKFDIILEPEIKLIGEFPEIVTIQPLSTRRNTKKD